MIDRDRKPDNVRRTRLDVIAALLVEALESEVDAPKKAAPEEPRARASGERRR